MKTEWQMESTTENYQESAGTQTDNGPGPQIMRLREIPSLNGKILTRLSNFQISGSLEINIVLHISVVVITQ